MATFLYKAATPDGKIVNGTLIGSSRDMIVRQLQAEGQIPIRIDEATTPAATGMYTRLRSRRVREEHIADATRELSILLRAGLPLERALRILVTLHATDPLAQLLEDIRTRVKEGATLADAFEAQGSVFSRFYISLLRAGESGGALETILERLAEHLDRNKEVRDTLVSAAIYPAILIVVAIVSVAVLLGYVVPQFREMFTDVDQVLPLATRITLGIGDLLQHYGLALLLLLVGVASIARWQLRRPANQAALHALLLKLPMIGPIVLKVEVARFARTLGILMQNGVPLLKALAIVKDTVGNRVLADGLDRVASGLKEGQSFAEPLAEKAHFPLLAVQMIRVGEESGNLESILAQVATTYDRETQVTIKRALAFLEPALILILGAVIGAVIISILAAILSINELVI
jgi:general secretion pathway protein F